jgi:hypothetical protein
MMEQRIRPGAYADIAILRQYLPLVENDLQEAHARFGTVDNLLR